MTRFEDWLFEPEPGVFGELARIPFSILSLPYFLAVKARTAAFRKNWLKTHQLDLPVISIGNLTLGGTGKTPTAVWLAQKLSEKGLKPGLSIRGYHSRAEKNPVLLTGKADQDLNPGLIGDEAAMIAQKLKSIPVLIGKNRIQAGEKAKELGVQVLILDDGFQHLKLKRNLDIVLIDGSKTLSREKIFPRGRLREPLAGLRRANLIIISRAQEQMKDLAAEIKLIHPAAPVFKMRYRVIGADQFAGRKAFAFAGIAEPEQFFDLAQSLKIHLAGKKSFSDHHYYQEGELRELEREAKEKGAEILLTTEKDLTRLKNFQTRIPLQALTIEPDFFGEEERILGIVIKLLAEWKNAQGA